MTESNESQSSTAISVPSLPLRTKFWRADVPSNGDPIVAHSAWFSPESNEHKRFLTMVETIRIVYVGGGPYPFHGHQYRHGVTVDRAMAGLKEPTKLKPETRNGCLKLGFSMASSTLAAEPMLHYRIGAPVLGHFVSVTVCGGIQHDRMMKCQAVCILLLSRKFRTPFDMHIRTRLARKVWVTRGSVVWDSPMIETESTQKKLKSE